MLRNFHHKLAKQRLLRGENQLHDASHWQQIVLLFLSLLASLNSNFWTSLWFHHVISYQCNYRQNDQNAIPDSERANDRAGSQATKLGRCFRTTLCWWAMNNERAAGEEKAVWPWGPHNLKITIGSVIRSIIGWRNKQIMCGESCELSLIANPIRFIVKSIA